jgi:hypothetical protein
MVVLDVDGVGGGECTDLRRGGVGRSRLGTALPYVIELHQEALVLASVRASNAAAKSSATQNAWF